MLIKSARQLLERPPRGYQAGATLRRALPEVKGGQGFAGAGPAATGLRLPGGEILCEVRERVERHFLMHIVALEFVLQVPAKAPHGARLSLTNTGMLFPTGVACRVPAGLRGALQGLAGQLENDPELNEALTRLNFRRCEVTGTEGGWTVRLEPFGGSEVVNRMPSFRRYIRLGDEQAGFLVAALKAFYRILSTPASIN